MDHADPELNVLMSVIAAHFAHRRDALSAIGSHADRLEQWVQWETVAALHHAQLLEPGPWFSSIGVAHEPAGSDVFVGVEPWSFGASEEHEWPDRDDRGVCLDLSAGTAHDKRGHELAAWIAQATKRLTTHFHKGRGLAVALIIRDPGRRISVNKVVEMIEKKAGRASYQRAIIDGSRTEASDLMHRTMGTSPAALAMLVAWDAR